jgi:hypothetical protein
LIGAMALGVAGLALAALAGAQGQPTAREMAYPKPTCDTNTQILDTKITKHPPKGKAGATFGFKAFYCNAPQAGSPPSPKFACNLDKHGFDKCSSPKTYSGLKRGKHSFKVKVTKASHINSSDPTPAGFKWKIH